MTSKIIVNTIEADTGISSVTFASNINLQNDSSVLVSSSGVRLGTGSTIAAPSANEITLSTNSAERIRLTSAGNLGIGDASPTKPLTVGTTTPVILLDDQSSRTLEIRGPSTTHNATVLTTSVHDLLLGTNNTERLRIRSAGGHRIQCDESWHAANLSECNTDRLALNVNKTRQGETKGIAIGCVGGGSGSTGIQCYDTSDNSANNLELNPFGGNIGIGSAIPANVLDVQGTTHTKIHVGTTGTGHATGIQINHAKGNAALQEWQLQTDASADGNLKVRNATSNVDVMFFDADNNNIGINDSTPDNTLSIKGIGSFDGDSNSFYFGSNFTGTGQNYIGSSKHAQRFFLNNASANGYFSYSNTGSAGTAGDAITWQERLRITSDGNMGLGVSPSYSGVFGGSQRVLHIGGTSAPGLRIQSSTTNQGDFIIQAGNSGGATYLSNLSNNADTVFFNTSGGSTTEKVRIYHGGQVTKPNQPAFNAKLSTATGANFNGFIVFNNPDHNIGSHYNTSNGKFTAPIAGRYLFNFYTNVYRDGGTGSIFADWYVNNSAKGFRMYTQYDGGWELVSGSIILSLSQNDYVQVYAGTSGNWDGGSYGSFNGYFLG